MTLQNLQKKSNLSKVILGHLQVCRNNKGWRDEKLKVKNLGG